MKPSIARARGRQQQQGEGDLSRDQQVMCSSPVTRYPPRGAHLLHSLAPTGCLDKCTLARVRTEFQWPARPRH